MYERTQRVREAESRVTSSTYKWATEGAVKGIPSILRRETYVSCQEYDCIP